MSAQFSSEEERCKGDPTSAPTSDRNWKSVPATRAQELCSALQSQSEKMDREICVSVLWERERERK